MEKTPRAIVTFHKKIHQARKIIGYPVFSKKGINWWMNNTKGVKHLKKDIDNLVGELLDI